MGKFLGMLGILAALVLCATPAKPQSFPITMPASTVYGRLGVTAGPGQAIPFNTLLAQFGLPASFFTRAQAQATTISAAVGLVELYGYEAVGDAPPAYYTRIATPSPARAWQFRSADGQWWGLSPINPIYVSQFGTKCDGVTDDTAVLKQVGEYINAFHPAEVNMPGGNAVCAIWTTSPVPAQDRLFDLTAPSGLTFKFNGAQLLAPATVWTDTSYVFVLKDGWNRVRIIGPYLNQPNLALSLPSFTQGAALVFFQDDGADLYIQGIKQYGGINGVAGNRTGGAPTSKRSRNITIEDAIFDSVFYPMNFRETGDQVTMTGIYSRNHGRFYFPYNVSNHFLRATIQTNGNILPEMPLKCFCVAGESAEYNTLRDIDIDVTILNDFGTVSGGLSFTGIGFQQQTSTACTGASIRNIRIRETVVSPTVGQSSILNNTFKQDSAGAAESTVRNYVIDGIDFSGDFKLTAQDVRTVDYFNATTGDFTGETIRNVRFHDLSIIGGAPTNDIIVDADSVTGLTLSNVVTTNAIAVTNVASGALAWSQLTIGTGGFSINGGSTATPLTKGFVGSGYFQGGNEATTFADATSGTFNGTLGVQRTVTGFTGSAGAIVGDLIWNNATAGQTGIGGQFYVSVPSSNSTNHALLRGSDGGRVQFNGSGTLTVGQGNASTFWTHGTGTVTTAEAMLAQTLNDLGGTHTVNNSIRIKQPVGPSTAVTSTWGSIRGLTIEDQNPTSSGGGGNTLTNPPAALLISGQTATGAFAIHQIGLGLNQFDGDVITTPIAVGSLPSCAAALKGSRRFVTDSNAALTAGIGAVVAAGGANNVPVVCDGTNWRIG